MTVKRRLSDDEITKIIEEMGPTPVGMRVETSATTLYDLALELRDRRLPTGYILPAGQTQSVADYPDLFEVLRKPSDIEVTAERLAKVEDRLAGTRSAHVATLDQRVVDERLKALDDRITKVAEIIGERVSGLVDEIAAVRDSAKRAHERVDDLRGLFGADHGTAGYASVMARLDDLESAGDLPVHPAPAFPTGGAGTAEAAANAVLPVPQRGDRVRLEGARGEVSGRPIKDGWYDVTGWSANQIQIRVTTDRNGNPAPDWLPWFTVGNSAIKEVQSHVTR